MFEFSHDVVLPALIIPAVASAVILMGIIYFAFIYNKTGNKLYSAIIYFSLCGLLFSICYFLSNLFGIWLFYEAVGRHFHRLEGIAVTYLLFAIPYFMVHLLELDPLWKKINRTIAMTGFCIACVITLVALVVPDLFISMNRPDPNWDTIISRHGRGAMGPLHMVRDIMLSVLIIYSLTIITVDILWHRRVRALLPTLIGILFVTIAGTDDIVYNLYHTHILSFSQTEFSRFSIGLVFFTLFIMGGATRTFVNQANQLQSTYTSMEGAYRILQKSEEKFLQLTEHINEVFIIYDFNNQVVLYVSPAYEQIWGQPIMSLYESPESWMHFIHHDDLRLVTAAFDPKSIRDQFELEYRIASQGDAVKWIRDRVFPIRDKRNNIYRLIRILEDITKRKLNEEQLVYVAYHDLLTNLPNRKSFFERLDDVLIQARRAKGGCRKAVLFIDLDNLKDINDMLGHDFGDLVIIEFAKRLKQAMRESDYVFRLGGDEFAIILNNISEDLDVVVVNKRIKDMACGPFFIEGREVFLGMSMGVSLYPRDGQDANDLVKHANIALHEARKEGNNTLFYSPSMNEAAIEKISIENNLRLAIEKNQFQLFYQPLVDPQGKITGMEALIRWIHPEQGFIPPDKFIPVAESTGLIKSIGLWVLHNACLQKRKWGDAGFNKCRVSVNLSARQFMDDALVENIAMILQDTGLDPKNLELEITESSIMKNPDDAVQKIDELAHLGINFSIDDFGTGYSSLSYLRRFHINKLKIDKSFIIDIFSNENNKEITKAIISLAHNMKLRVTAEGVETQEHVQLLRSLDCDELQGYYFSRPIPPEQFIGLLEKRIIEAR